MMQKEILLPQVAARYIQKAQQVTNEKYLLLVLGGRAPSVHYLQQMAQNWSIWAVDRGLDACIAANILPERLIGDGDSAKKSSLAWAKTQAIPFDQFPSEKDDTDTQLALRLAKEPDTMREILVTGAFGGRLDHAFATIECLAHTPLCICAADDNENLFFLRNKDSVQFKFIARPKVVSLLPFSKQAEDVTISGVHWELHHAMLYRSSAEYSISNKLLPNTTQCTVSLQRGILGVYFYFGE